MAPSVTTAKYVLVPIVLAIFIIYSGYLTYIYIVQTPGISITLAYELPTLPFLTFVLPFGEDVRTIFNRGPVAPQPNTTWHPFYALVERAGDNDFGVLPDVFSLQNRSFVHPDRPEIPQSTMYVLDPQQRKWDPPSRSWAVILNRENLVVPGTQPPPALPYIEWQVRGSRFTREPDFSALIEQDISKYPPNFNPYRDQGARVSITRDVNSVVDDGMWGYLSTYTIKPFEYRYLNGSRETYYEVASIGRVQADNGTLSIVIRLATRYITVYQEHQVISGAQTLASISAAFQILLLTGLMFLFGQGRYSPYGLIHRILPRKSTVPSYVPLGQDEMSRFRFFVNEYLDTTPLGIGAPPPRKRPLPISAVSIMAVVFALTAFILYLLALFGGSKDVFAREVNFLVIENANEPPESSTKLALALWGWCKISKHTYDCSDVPFSELFSSFSFNATVQSSDQYPKKTNAIDFVLLLGACVFMAIAVSSRIVSFWLRSLNGTSDVVAPSTSFAALLSGFIAFATVVQYYSSIKHNVEAWGDGWKGHLGIGVTMVGIATLFNLIAFLLLLWELRELRTREKDMEEWKRRSYQGEPQVIVEDYRSKGSFDGTLRDEEEQRPHRRSVI